MHLGEKVIIQRDVQLKLDLTPQWQLLLSFVYPSTNYMHIWAYTSLLKERHTNGNMSFCTLFFST